MKLIIPKSKILLAFLFFVFAQTMGFGATITSTGTGGLWNVGGSWVGGFVPDATDDVVIASGSIVTFTGTTSVSAKSITILGTLRIPQDRNVTLNSALIVVTSSGTIYFNKKAKISLPSNVALYLQHGLGSLTQDPSGGCSNNTEILVGNTSYSTCSGGAPDFEGVETAGGINNTTNSASSGTIGTSQTICSGAAPVALTSTADGTGSGIIKYEWQTNASGSYVTIPGATSKTYSPPALTATTSYQRRTVSVIGSSTVYSAYATPVTITVLRAIGGTVSGSTTVCLGTNSTVLTLSGHNGSIVRWESSLNNFATAGATIANTTTTLSTTNLSSTTSYRAVLQTGSCTAVNSGSATISVTPLPNSPSDIRGDNLSCNGYIVRWEGSATKFYLDVATTNTFDEGTIISTYNNKDVGNVKFVTLTGLNPSTIYYFRVRAFNSSCLSNNSSTGTFTTLSVAVPTNLTSDNVSWCRSTIRWDGSATKFYLDVATSNTFSSGTILPAYNNIDVGNVNSITLSGLLPNTAYYFRVRRLETCGLSANPLPVSFTTLLIPTPTAISGWANCNDWMAQWNNASVDGYYLDVATDNAFTNYVSGYENLDVGNVIAYNLTGLARGGTYYYRVRAKTSC